MSELSTIKDVGSEIELAKTPEEANIIRAKIDAARRLLPQIIKDRIERFGYAFEGNWAYIEASIKAGGLWNEIKPGAGTRSDITLQKIARFDDAGFANSQDATICSRLSEMHEEDIRTYKEDCRDSDKLPTLGGLYRWWRELNPIETPPLPEGIFSTIYADPPWQFDNTGFDQSAASHYPTMATADICILPIQKYGAGVLFLWATNAMLIDALEVMRAWGFEYKSNIVWQKTRGPSIGWFVRSRHELLLIGTARPGAHPIERPLSIISAPVAEHSRKPDKFYELIQSMYLGPYLELFARRKYSDEWTVWGNEIEQQIRD